MQRIFHVPSHLTYAAKLTGRGFAPVSSTTGQPMRVDELLRLRRWDFFDVLHLHSVELAGIEDLEHLAVRIEAEDKGLVFTAHDLAPNIETDRAAFNRKTALMAHRASEVMTLTTSAAAHLAAASGRDVASVRIAPHGAALPLDLVGETVAGNEIAMFGALRPNRAFLSVLSAWRLLPPPRPRLRCLIRSRTTSDDHRYAEVLDELQRATLTESGFTITTTPEVLPPRDLVSWCSSASALVLPYSEITHSGQLELARDLGLRLLAPDMPGLRSQLDEGPPCSVAWFPRDDLGDSRRFARHMERALSLPAPTPYGGALRNFRTAEHARLLEAHRAAYLSATSPTRSKV